MIHKSNSNSNTTPFTMWNNSFHSKIICLLTYALLYGITYKIGMIFYIEEEAFSSLWPASGFALAVYVAFPRRSWIWFAAVQAFIHAVLSWNSHIVPPLFMSFASIFESCSGAFMVKKIIAKESPFEHTYSMLFFITGCLAASIAGASISATGMHLFFNGETNYWTTFQHLTLSLFCGMLLFCPLLLHLFSINKRQTPLFPRKIESILFLFICVGMVINIFVFKGYQNHMRSIVQSPMLLILLLMWGVFRLSTTTTAIALSVVGIMASIFTDAGFGPLHEIYHDWPEIALGLQIYLTIMAITIYLLNAITTEHTILFQKVKKDEQRYRELVDNAKTAIISINKSNQITFFNEYAESLFEFSSAEVLGKSVLDTIVPKVDSEGNDLKIMAKNFLDGIGPAYEVTNENETITKSGKHLKMVWQNEAIIDEKGEFAGLLSVGLDITDRYNAEKKLASSHQQLKCILDSIDAVVNVIDIQTHKILFVNSLSRKKYGDVIGKTCWKVFQDDQKGPCSFCSLQKPVHLNESAPDTTTIEFQNKKTGRWFEMRSRIIPWTDKHTAILKIITDITDKKVQLEKDNQHREQLIRADKLKSLGVMVGSVAHSINNPVMFLDMGSENLSSYLRALRPILDEYCSTHKQLKIMGKSREEIDLQISQILSGMHEGCARIASVVANLKHFSRSDDEYLYEVINLNTIAKSAAEICKEFINKSTARFSLILSPGHNNIKGNSQHLEQVIVNLLTNACQALSNNQQSITIETGNNDDWEWIKVSDEGCGISDEHLSKITTPLFTTRGALGGTGIGMSVSKEIIDRHHGTIQYTSTVGNGTTAEIRLPTLNKIIPSESS